MASILYTYRGNLQGPISTIHREVGRRLPEHQVTMFGSYPVTGIDNTIIVPKNMTAVDIPKLIIEYGKKYDAVHTGPQDRDHLVRLTALRGAMHIHTLHAAPKEPETIRRERRLTDHADHVTANSEYVRQWALDTLDIEKQITVVPNGVDLNIFEPVESPAEQTFVFVGRLVDQKHPEQVLRLARERPDATFKICGSGPLEDQVVYTAQSLENVEMVPKLTHPELAKLYADATAVLCPYEREGFGMVVIESMASGTPVVGLNSGNLPALIKGGHNGILCDSLDLDEWLTALEDVQGNRERFKPRESVKRYSWDTIASLYESLYDELLL